MSLPILVFQMKEFVMKAAKLCVVMLFAPLSAGLFCLGGCGSEPATPQQRKQLVNDSGAALKDMEIADSTLADKVNSAAGYAVFPNVDKGAVGIGVGSGNGDVYQGGKYIGQAHLTIGTVGVALGGEAYKELILFETPAALSDFENNGLKFDANASAVALQAGAAASSKWANHIMVFKQTNGGLMADASIGGQQFTFKAANPMPATQP
jgi:hypothetical protein